MSDRQETELGRLSLAIRYLLETAEDPHPGEIKDLARDQAESMDQLRRKFYQQAATERAIARAWTKP